jgi:hypothetical protein
VLIVRRGSCKKEKKTGRTKINKAGTYYWGYQASKNDYPRYDRE